MPWDPSRLDALRAGAEVGRHRQRVEHLLVPMVARYELGEMRDTPEGRAVIGADADLRPSLAVAALSGPASGSTAGVVGEVRWSDQWPAELIRSLVRSRIAWDAASASLVIRLAAASDFDDERIQLALKAADNVAEHHPGHPEVMDALESLRRSVDDAATHRYRVPEMRARVVAAIARHSPPDLLDLTPISTDDSWGPSARAVFGAAEEQGAAAGAVLAALLVGPTASKPTASWRRGLEGALHGPAERQLVRELVTLLVGVEVSPDRPFVATGNDVIARAAVWALGSASVDTDVDLLERVAQRCSRTNGQPYVTEALCARAVGAAVTVLADLRSSELALVATEALERLWSTVERADVLKRVGAALGRPAAEVTARQKQAKQAKEKGRKVRADPEPSARRALLSEVIKDDLTPRLGAHGFDQRSRNTFRRRHVDRTDLVVVSTADSMVQVRFGVAFHRPDGPSGLSIDQADIAAEMALRSSDPSGGALVQPQELSSPWLEHRAAMSAEHFARRSRRGDDDPVEVLFALVERFEAHGLPALERWSQPDLVARDLEELEVPFPHGVLLLGLDLPGSAERRAAVARLRSLG